MATAVEVPLLPAQARILTIRLADVTYNMRMMYDDAQSGCWILDIGDEDGNLLVAGIPLVSGVDLLSQYAHLDFGGALVLVTDRNVGEVPGFNDLGVTSHLYFITPD